MTGRPATAAPIDPAAQAAGLLAENRRLRHRIAALEAALYAAGRLEVAAHMTRHERVLLDLLASGRVVTVDQAVAAMEAACPTPEGRGRDAVHQAAMKLRATLRRELGDGAVTVRCERSAGYWIDADGRRALLAAFGPPGVRPAAGG